MTTSNTKIPVYSFDFDFNNLTASCNITNNGVDIIINFNFDFDITNVQHSKGDYFTPDSWDYDFTHSIDIEDAYYFLDDKPYKVTEHNRQIINDLIESDIKLHIDSEELYKD